MLSATVTRRPRDSNARTPASMRGISEGDEIASTTTRPLRWSARGGMSIRADNSKGGAERSRESTELAKRRALSAGTAESVRTCFAVHPADREARRQDLG